MKSNDKFSNIILAINKNIIRVLIGIMTLSLILGTAHLIQLEIQKVYNHPYYLVDVSTLLEVFNLILIIAVGYELIKALLLIISSNIIPTLQIVEISIIAISTKIITLNIQETESNIIISLALLVASLGFSYYVLKYRIPPQNNRQ